MEVYFAAPLMGAVLHTVNFRLSAQDITYIVNHAGRRGPDRRREPLAALEPIRKSCTPSSTSIVMQDTPAADVPPGALDYEELVARADAGHRVAAPRRDGRRRHVLHVRHHRPPEGRRLHHRAIYLHSLRVVHGGRARHLRARRDPARSCPMFHANAWCVPFAGDHDRRDPDLRRAQPAAARHHRDRPGRAGHGGRRGARRCGSPCRAAARRSRSATSRRSAAIPIGGSAAPRAPDRAVRQEVRRLRCSTPGA